MLNSIKSEISEMGWQGKVFKPHKIVAILAAIEVLKITGFKDTKIPFSDDFKQSFSNIFANYVSEKHSCRPHTPFFHLRSASFWNLIPKNGKEIELVQTTTVGGPGALTDIVDYAKISDDFLKILQVSNFRDELTSFLLSRLEEGKNIDSDNAKQGESMLDSTSISNCDSLYNNPFVGYLNSLQQVGGSNENALAESQACNSSFSHLHVNHPLAQIIFDELHSEPIRHVILTGHAGDGKSTLAIDVLKMIKGINISEPLSDPIGLREDLDGSDVTVIKDLSEQNKKNSAEFVKELFEGKRRFLLVSNTGTLLNLFKENNDILGLGRSHLESSLLDAISYETGVADLNLNGTKFKVFNLARMDNLQIARQIFEKMIVEDRWKICEDKPCRKNCPICVNVDLIQQNKHIVVDRIFLGYRRMFEYGTRLTLRQLTEHLAYMITSGIEGRDIQDIQERNHRPLKIQYLFFNRFFGDNGFEIDATATRMKSVKEIIGQGFGERPSPIWEHRLWLRTYGQSFKFGVNGCQTEFEFLRERGSRITRNIESEITPDRAREQVRRMLYFLYDFENKDQGYIGQYLNSPTLLNWMDWQKPEVGLGFNEKTTLERKIYHVLQEHFTGVRMPEGSEQNDRRLYITLSRRRSEVRQSAQIVLAQIDWSTATDLRLIDKYSANGSQRKELALLGKGPISGIDLHLSVPFLDYVFMRHFGELGEVLQASYIERLDSYKSKLQQRTGIEKNERIMLVHLKTDHTFQRQQYGVHNGRLEVSNVL